MKTQADRERGSLSKGFLIDILLFKRGMSTDHSLSYHESFFEYMILRSLFLFADDSCFLPYVCQVTTICFIMAQKILNFKCSDFKSHLS